jgi:sulfoxide reductase heme-binding subunit YedZ
MNVYPHVWWLMSRSAGIVALLAMTASVMLGLALAGRLAGTRVKAFAAVHEHLALISLVAISVHGEALLGDRFLEPGVLGISVPFVMGYRPLATGLGIIGGWLAAALGLSFYARRRFGPKRWRQLHRFTTVAWALAVVHTLFAGTDAGSTWLRAPVLGSAGVVAALLSARLLGRRSGSRRSSRPRTTASARSPG